jgi:hypothetical protein
MDVGSSEGWSLRGIRRSRGYGIFVFTVVLFMVAGAFLPSVSAAPSPDLVVNSGEISIAPQPLVVGVEATVTFSVTNIGVQNAYGFNVTLIDAGTEVDSLYVETLAIDDTLIGWLEWTPVTSGIYNIEIHAWYGPGSSKEDMNWDNNNVTHQVNVHSRPDAALSHTDLSYDAPNTEYITDGETVVIHANVNNGGTADIASCNVSLWEAAVGPGGELIELQPAISVPGDGAQEVTFIWNTTGWSGKRRLIVDVTDVAPNETDLSNNRAMIVLKIHTIEDLNFHTNEEHDITTPFKIQFFITIRDSATLTITETGNVTMFQEFDDQYDIEVMDKGKLIVDGGALRSDLNFTVRLMDEAQLIVMDGAYVMFRIEATGDSDFMMEGSELTAASISMVGGMMKLEGSNLTTDSLTLANTELYIDSSVVTLQNTLYIDGQNVEINDTDLRVVREFEDYLDALDVYPQIEFYNVDTYEVDLPPAMVAVAGAHVDLKNVSVESTVSVLSEDATYWTTNRLDAEGRTSVINIWRYVMVEVRDWSYQSVPAADVEVLDYFTDTVVSTWTTDEDGNTIAAVRTDYVIEAQRPYVGNLRMRASTVDETSEDIRFSHSKYPDMSFESNVMTVTIKLPPNPHPPIGEVFREYTDPFLVSGGMSAANLNIIVNNTELKLKDTTFILEQEFNFEWFILVKGENGVLKLENATLTSGYTFAIYLEGGGTLWMAGGSGMPNVRVIAEEEPNQASIKIIDSTLSGGIYANCQLIEFAGSELELTDTHLEAKRVSINGGSVHEHGTMLIDGTEVELIDVELSAAYELGPASAFFSLKDIPEFFGWGLLNDIDALANISLGFFNYFAIDSNITIQATRLTTSGAFVYATEVNILVRRSSISDQTIIEGSYIGGINLTLVSDDIYAKDSSFNRVLDDFAKDDSGRFYNVEVPGIVCKDNAEVKRYWFLTVYCIDGAGSIRPGALLEVVSTETNETLLPAAGTENLPSSRTNVAGRITVAILANRTDETGDYFVGSIRFRVVFDKLQFENDPVYSDWRQHNMKSNLVITMRIDEVITPPLKEIIYYVYNVTYAGPSQDLKRYHHTFEQDADALVFLNETMSIDPDRVRNWSMVRNGTVQMVFSASAQINEIWSPLLGGEVRIYILQGPSFDPNNPFENADGEVLKWVVWPGPDDDGVGSLNLSVPDTLGSFQLYIEISGGDYDPSYQPIYHRFWNFTVVPPQTIEIVAAYLSPDRIEVGTLMDISGNVRYIYGNVGVIGGEMSVTGTHIGTGQSRTDEEGRFTITMQAPIIVMNNLSLLITATDPITDETATWVINYNVYPPYEPPEEDEFPWKGVMIGLIVLGIIFAVGVGSVVVYRKHYGDLVECGECGAFIPASSQSCPKCGIEFETDLARCSECEAWIPANSTSCPVCGTAFTIESLEEQVALEEADQEIIPVDQVTTSTARMAPLALDGASTDARWGDREEKRRRRIKKRVKKRLTVAETSEDEDEVSDEEAKDLFIGDEEVSTRLPGLGVDESALSDEELQRLLPTEDMLKELMLTSEQVPTEEGAEDLMDDTDLLDEEGEEPDEEGEPSEEPSEDDEGGEELDIDEAPEESEDEGLEALEELEEIPPPEDADEDIEVPEEDAEEAPEEEEMPPEGDEAPEEDLSEGRELLSELGLMAESGEVRLDQPSMEPSEEDDTALAGLLTDEESKEAPKLCPNCGGNWILYKDGEYTCRICGETW